MILSTWVSYLAQREGTADQPPVLPGDRPGALHPGGQLPGSGWTGGAE